MADLNKWLEALLGPQIAGLVGSGGGGGGGADKSPIVAGGALAPPAPAGPSVTDPIAAPPPIDLLGTTPQDAPLPGLGGPPMPPDDISVLQEGAAPLKVPGAPLNAALGLEPPDPTRVENMGSLVPPNVDVAVPDVAPVAGATPAVAAPIANRKRAAPAPAPRPAQRPLSPVPVTGRSAVNRGNAPRRTGPMGTPLYEGGFRPMTWSDRLSPRK